ncbi:MAG TPA: site-specific DNA-methyltransferase, partial [Blastocatellia bacterium]|nr:site-specific DNA-methyltransferase [Blastocatellia bacterium]
MSESNLSKFKKLLAELFMLDQADLDFGIYRIMNAKRDEITRFLDNDLLPQVRQSLAQLESGDRAQIESELAKAIEQAKELGVDAETTEKVKRLREQLSATADIEAIESEVFSHLYEFFRRYYSDGDFLSLRRYKAGVYAIPYEGEEVKLHWANSDQYYIKTSENFRDYAFKLADGRRVHFKLADADTETNNNKAANGNERRFILNQGKPVEEQDGELIITFEYRPDTEKRKQAQLNTEAVDSILSAEELIKWTAALGAKLPTEKNKDRTVLEKHLTDYSAKNTFDYFIHKDLGGFLRRELDFYIKNEVMYLDDIESDTAPRVEQYIAKIKAMRRIAHKVIDFLAHLEDFQKKLWLKKKFIVETNYCITLDRLPDDLYPEIVTNAAQREEWVRLFAIDEIAKDLHGPEYSVPLTVEFLKANSFLLLDTKYFDAKFKDKLLTGLSDLDEQIDGLLIHSENFQAINLLQSRYMGQVKCIYIDPPYNTSATPIPVSYT